jgi:hypothetical protein
MKNVSPRPPLLRRRPVVLLVVGLPRVLKAIVRLQQRLRLHLLVFGLLYHQLVRPLLAHILLLARRLVPRQCVHGLRLQQQLFVLAPQFAPRLVARRLFDQRLLVHRLRSRFLMINVFLMPHQMCSRSPIEIFALDFWVLKL